MRSLWLATLLLITGCAMFGGASEPTREELERACPPAFIAWTVDCPAIALTMCGDGPWTECADQEAVETKCDALIEKRIAECEAK